MCVREKNALDNLVLPGVNRHMMPAVASKSKRLRDAERPGVYPFSTMPVEDTERALILKAFQELIHANQIDTPNSSHYKYKMFERSYQ